MMQQNSQPAVDEKQAAVFLGLSVHWMRRARWAGNGPAFLKYGSAVRYLPEVLVTFRESRARKSTSDSGNGTCAAGTCGRDEHTAMPLVLKKA